MYFASEPCNVSAVCGALTETIKKQPELTWLALVDGAFDYKQTTLELPNKWYALYDDDMLSDLLAASPYLIKLTTHDEHCLRRELITLVRHRKERPMLSFIGASSSADLVNQNFRLFANAVTEDDQAFLLRFADTRVLPGLASALRPAYWDGMTCLLSAWIFIDRDGKPQALSLSENRTALREPFQLSPAEFATLVTNSEPDAVLNVIAESNPDALPDIHRAAIYGRAVDACDFAYKHNVRAFPDVVALTYLALLDDGNALKDPRLSEMLLRLQWESGNLIHELIEIL